MKTKSAQYIFWTSTILISLWFGASGFFELTKNELVWNITQQLGYPAHFIYLLGVLILDFAKFSELPMKVNN